MDMDYEMFAVIAAFIGSIMIYALIFYALQVIAMWKIFTKAGREGWISLIPIYNYWVWFEIAGMNGANILWNFLPFIGQIIFGIQMIISNFKIAKKFGKSDAFGIGLIFLNFIFMLILAFDDSKYQV